MSVIADEAVLAGFKVVRDPPTIEAWDRISSELSVALDVFDQHGWLEDPGSYHREPIVPEATMRLVRGWETRGLGWEQLRWTSEWMSHRDEPGTARWASYARNERASAWILRHRDDTPRHWAVLLHGTEQGRLLVDQQVFRARHLYEELGCNVVMPVLPLHASRRPADGADSGFPTLDVLDNVHGLAQSAYDVRCLLAWVRQQRPRSISLTGLSLGGGVAALVAGLEEPLGAVVGLVPAVDFPELFRRQTPRRMRRGAAVSKLAEDSTRLHGVVSPLSFTPATPAERRYLVAGLHDRLLDPLTQAGRLAEHWQTDQVTWLDRGHVTHMRDHEMLAVLSDAIRSAPDLTS